MPVYGNAVQVAKQLLVILPVPTSQLLSSSAAAKGSIPRTDLKAMISPPPGDAASEDESSDSSRPCFPRSAQDNDHLGASASIEAMMNPTVLIRVWCGSPLLREAETERS